MWYFLRTILNPLKKLQGWRKFVIKEVPKKVPLPTWESLTLPVNLERAPNSTMKVPTPAVHVIGVSPKLS